MGGFTKKLKLYYDFIRSVRTGWTKIAPGIIICDICLIGIWWPFGKFPFGTNFYSFKDHCKSKSKLTKKSYLLLAEKGNISPEALRFLITFGVTSGNITLWGSGGDSSLWWDRTVKSTWSYEVYDFWLMLLLLWLFPSFLHFEKLLLRFDTKPKW